MLFSAFVFKGICECDWKSDSFKDLYVKRIHPQVSGHNQKISPSGLETYLVMEIYFRNTLKSALWCIFFSVKGVEGCFNMVYEIFLIPYLPCKKGLKLPKSFDTKTLKSRSEDVCPPPQKFHFLRQEQLHWLHRLPPPQGPEVRKLTSSLSVSDDNSDVDGGDVDGDFDCGDVSDSDGNIVNMPALLSCTQTSCWHWWGWQGQLLWQSRTMRHTGISTSEAWHRKNE